MDTSVLTVTPADMTKFKSGRAISKWTNLLFQAGLATVLLMVVTLLLPCKTIAQTGTVGGTVTDAVTGEPLSGSRVSILNSNIKSSTDSDGRYMLRGVPAGSQTLVVAHVGYFTQESAISVMAGGHVDQPVEVSGRFYTVDDDEYVIARRRSQSRALNRQWEPVNLKSVISSEQRNRFGDYTVERTMIRIPGVQVSGMGEVNLRGLGNDRYNVTVDGMRMASTGIGNRGFDLSSISADVIQDLEIIKVLTPDMEADALAGTVNIVTHRLAGDQREIDAQLGGGANTRYFEYSGPGTRTSLNYAETPRDDFSISVNLSHQLDHTGWESLGVEYAVADFGNGPVDVIERVAPGLHTHGQNRISGGIQLTFQPNDRTSYHLRGLVNNNNRTINRHITSWNAGGDWVDQTTTGPQGSYMYDYSIQIINVQQHAFQFEARHLFNRINLDYGAGWAQGRFHQEQRRIPFTSGGREMTINMQNRKKPTMELVSGDILRQDMVLQVMNREVNDHIENKVSGRVDLEFPFRAGSIKVGSSARRINKDGGYKNVDLTAVGSVRLTGFDLARVNELDVADQYLIRWILDEEMTTEFFDTGLPVFRKDEHLQRRRSNIWNYDAAESVYSGYGMTTLDFGRLSVLGGVRMEHTMAEYDGKRAEFGGALARHDTTFVITEIRDYTHIFPNAQLKLSTGPWSNVRLAYSKSLHRADYNLLVPFHFINKRDSILFHGNPDLNPMMSDNLDLHFEYYFSDPGSFSVGLFYKQLSDGFVIEMQGPVGDGEFEGYHGRTFINSEETAEIYGLEVSWQQNLLFLPGFLRHLSTYANYTWSHSVFNANGREDEVSLPFQSPHVINAALDYTRGRISTQLSYHWTAEAVNSLQQTMGMAPSVNQTEAVYLDQYQDGWTDVSISILYRLTPHFQIWADVFNLLESERFQYTHTRNVYPIGTDFRRGREFRAGIRFNL